MFKLPIKLAFKYFRSNKGGIFSFTSFLAVTGLSIGVASLIIVMSVMNGFEKELQNRILGVVPHAVIYSDEPIGNYESLIKDIKKNENVLEAHIEVRVQSRLLSSHLVRRPRWIFGSFCLHSRTLWRLLRVWV